MTTITLEIPDELAAQLEGVDLSEIFALGLRVYQAEAANQDTVAIPYQADDWEWLNDSEADMQVEDARWVAMQTRQPEKLAALIEAAQAEIEADTTQPMFDEQGKKRLA